MTLLVVAVLVWIFWAVVAIGLAVAVRWAIDRLTHKDDPAAQILYFPSGRAER